MNGSLRVVSISQGWLPFGFTQVNVDLRRLKVIEIRVKVLLARNPFARLLLPYLIQSGLILVQSITLTFSWLSIHLLLWSYPFTRKNKWIFTKENNTTTREATRKYVTQLGFFEDMDQFLTRDSWRHSFQWDNIFISNYSSLSSLWIYLSLCVISLYIYLVNRVWGYVRLEEVMMIGQYGDWMCLSVLQRRNSSKLDRDLVMVSSSYSRFLEQSARSHLITRSVSLEPSLIL